jgi:hypothetical protein
MCERRGRRGGREEKGKDKALRTVFFVSFLSFSSSIVFFSHILTTLEESYAGKEVKTINHRKFHPRRREMEKNGCVHLFLPLLLSFLCEIRLK